MLVTKTSTTLCTKAYLKKFVADNFAVMVKDYFLGKINNLCQGFLF